MTPANIASLLSLLVSITVAVAGSSFDIPPNRRIWCYYTNWSQYRPVGWKYTVKDVDPHLCTHASYAFAIMKDNKVVPFEYNDDDNDFSEGMYTKFNKLRLQNPRLKTFLAVGGWNFCSVKFSEMVRSAKTRRIFVDSVVKFLRQRNFDGLDFDWEYPAQRGGQKDDKKYFTLLVKELHDSFVDEALRTNQKRLLLATAVGSAKEVVDSAYDVPEISRYIDFLNIMTYDFHGPWENNTAHSSPLFPGKNEAGESRNWNTAWAARNWLEKGAPLHKINVGIPLYGHSFTLSNPMQNGVGAFAPKSGKAGPVTRINGSLSYFEACDMLKNGAKKSYIREQKVPYLVQNDQWLGYEDVESVVAKVEWILQNKFSGVMVWAIDLDDYKGVCKGGQYPLMRAINQAMSKENRETTTSVPDITFPVNKDINCLNLPFGVYTDPTSCFRYIYCWNGHSYTYQCPLNMEWNTSRKNCVPYGQGDCKHGSI